MHTTFQHQLSQIIKIITRPMARAVMKRGLSYDIFDEAARSSFVEVAAQDFVVPGKRQTTSRISMISGLSRKEVSRLQNNDHAPTTTTPISLNRAAKVISGWLSDAEYLDENRQPRVLDIDSNRTNSEADFASLVKKYSGDITAATIQEELKRINAIELDPSGKVKLLKAGYIPAKDSLEQLQLLAEDISELMETIEYNIAQQETSTKRFQRKVTYDNIPAEYVPELKAYIENHAQNCLIEANHEIAQYDRDKNKTLNGTGRNKLCLAIHYYEEAIE